MAQNNSAILVQIPRVTFFWKKLALKPYLYHNSNRVTLFKFGIDSIDG